MVLLYALLACGGSSPSGEPQPDPPPVGTLPTLPTAPQPTTPTLTTDTAPLDTALPTVPEGLYGDLPAANLPLPEAFVAHSRTGATRGPEDLVGRPTVMWFYPAAATGG